MPIPNLRKAYENGWKAIVRPPKLEYSIGDLGLPQFTVGSSTIQREDFTLTNKRGNTLACSFFENTSSSSPLPCVVYCHANGSCRLEALQYKQVVLNQNFHFFCFDFSTCGHSTGEYASVGYFEQEDIERVVEHLKQTGKVTKIGLWGRSMGAVSSIMYSSRNPSISCLVLDSPFADFKRLVQELVKNKADSVPGFAINIGLSMVRKTVKKKAGFDIYDLKTIEFIKKIKIPALLGAPKDDTFVSPQHTKDLYLAHCGMKQLAVFEGDHNSQRSVEWTMSAINFIKSQLGTVEVEQTIQPNYPSFKASEEIGSKPASNPGYNAGIIPRYNLGNDAGSNPGYNYNHGNNSGYTPVYNPGYGTKPQGMSGPGEGLNTKGF